MKKAKPTISQNADFENNPLLKEDDVITSLRIFLEKRFPYKETASKASSYIKQARNNSNKFGLEAFFTEYGLGSDEGIAVMSMAESLLRIPDNKTASQLIYDKLHNTKWQKHKSKNSLVNISSLGLSVAGKMLNIGSLVKNIADPVIRESIKKSMQFLGRHFVIGEELESAFKETKTLRESGYIFSFDMLGEAARTELQAKKYFKSYNDAINFISDNVDHNQPLYKRDSISVKLSALYPRYELIKEKEVMENLLPRLKNIIQNAFASGISVTIDAEEASRLDISLKIFANIIKDPDFEGFSGIGLAVQAYNKRAMDVLKYVNSLASEHKKIIPVRLVKGAYWDTEIKKAQVLGLEDYPVFTRKENTDISYLAAASFMLESDLIYPQFATHNAFTIAAIENMAGSKEFEFQLLYGMGESVYSQIAGRYPCRIYAPIGHYNELLPYLIRRLLENSANSSFVKKISDINYDIKDLTKNPLEIPSGANKSIPLPCEIYQNRSNPEGFDIGYSSQLKMLQKKLKKYEKNKWQCYPIINGKDVKSGIKTNINPPYNIHENIGISIETDEKNIKKALKSLNDYFPLWNGTDVNHRANIIEKFADLLDKNRFELISLCMMEAGKTLSDSIAEVREAIDFCRYYSIEARKIFGSNIELKGATGESNKLKMSGRGVIICISPWNFPLAIFTGQITAALLSGNTVIAKPAEQTPLISYLAIRLLLEAGLPENAIALLPGRGETVGKLITGSNNIHGVIFTGSLDTAKIINNNISKKAGSIIPLIAETGGLNTMIVDSSALLEQAADDIINSAFGSSGQRCSALRAVYIQEEIADSLIALLEGMVNELKAGYPTDFSTDISSLIDESAKENVLSYIKKMKTKHTLLAKGNISDNLSKSGHFVAPHILSINSINDMPSEIFGPVLHVVRFNINKLDSIINEINASGYGLTFGIHSRLESRIKYLSEKIKAGNIYINRSMTGAVVGVQPFGGEGLSGTGPKAGGPHYLIRLSTEKVITENTTAIGGNRELLSY